jgi:hypothetical protein
MRRRRNLSLGTFERPYHWEEIMFYVAIIDHTNKKILYPEQFESKEDAARRRGHLDLHWKKRHASYRKQKVL